MSLPQDHPLRIELHNEIHARPPQPIAVPARISYLALVSPPEHAEAEREHIRALCRLHGVAPSEPIGTHVIADFGAFRLKWERHAEFARYQVTAEGGSADAFAAPAIGLLPADWVAGLPGALLLATNVALAPATAEPDYDAVSKAHFAGNTLVGAAIADGAGIALTDFRIAPDGFGRVMIFDRSMTPRQAGRTVQRLLEIDTYRMMALLAFPVARELRPFLARSDAELAAITGMMTQASARDDPALLDRLVKLEAAIDSRHADHQYRFSAAEAYYGLVQGRIGELRELRLPGLQTFAEFMERRLAPAMSTCRSVSEGLAALSERVERCTQLLSTRVGIAREQQNQALLETMARRAKLQLRLQQTVEGLSVAAISYYVVGLIGYAAKALKAGGLHLDPELVVGAALPLVILFAAFGIRGIRKRLTLDGGARRGE
jgi:uncharacterized membrane-anchored protein